MTDLSNIPAQSQQWPGTDAALTPAADHGETSWTPRGRLTGKRALVTGGDSGIGRAVAVLFAHEGADVVIASLPQEEADAAETVAQVERIGGRCRSIAGDLRTEDACRALAREAVDALGGLDVLVCNAAYQMTYDELEQFPPGQLQQTFATNVFSTFWLVQNLAGELENGGNVIVTTSIQAYSPSTHLLDYAATKAALNNLTVNLAGDLGARNSRQRRRARPHLDAAHTRHHGPRQSGGVRVGHAPGPGGAAGGGGRCLCVSRL